MGRAVEYANRHRGDAAHHRSEQDGELADPRDIDTERCGHVGAFGNGACGAAPRRPTHVNADESEKCEADGEVEDLAQGQRYGTDVDEAAGNERRINEGGG